MQLMDLSGKVTRLHAHDGRLAEILRLFGETAAQFLRN